VGCIQRQTHFGRLLRRRLKGEDSHSVSQD
jgi:hypothetical protein